MTRRLPALLLVLPVLLAACTSGGQREDDGDRGEDAIYRACDGLHLDVVRGRQPSYVEGELADFPGSDAMCQGLWLPAAEDGFVPQGLALDGRTAWVSGYRWRPGYGNRPCRLQHVSLRTGELLGSTERIEGSVGGRPETFCRHGGALSLDRHGLWVLETDRLWLVDPDRVGRADQVRRVWRVQDPVRGSVMATRGGRFALGAFDDARPGALWWYSSRDLLAPGVDTIGTRASATSIAPVRTGSVVRRVQGAFADAEGLWQTSSVSTCGRLVTPSGERVAFGPGAEGLELDGRGGVWAVLESGARNYQRDGRPLVPMLARFDLSRVVDGPRDRCGW